MTIEVEIVRSPIVLEPRSVPGCGAVARFDGVVRGEEEGAEISALEYEAYEDMARRVIRHILEDLARKYPVALARVHHRVGMIRVGEAAITVEVHSKHRGEAFAVLTQFMDRLKKEVPIWKVGRRNVRDDRIELPTLKV